MHRAQASPPPPSRSGRPPATAPPAPPACCPPVQARWQGGAPGAAEGAQLACQEQLLTLLTKPAPRVPFHRLTNLGERDSNSLAACLAWRARAHNCLLARHTPAHPSARPHARTHARAHLLQLRLEVLLSGHLHEALLNSRRLPQPALQRLVCRLPGAEGVGGGARARGPQAVAVALARHMPGLARQPCPQQRTAGRRGEQHAGVPRRTLAPHALQALSKITTVIDWGEEGSRKRLSSLAPPALKLQLERRGQGKFGASVQSFLTQYMRAGLHSRGDHTG